VSSSVLTCTDNCRPLALAGVVNCWVVSAIRLRSFVGVGREGYIGYGA
jgi:hypothetical protein